MNKVIEYEYIVYKTTNLVNGKIYVGVHRTVKGVTDSYIGCGVKGNGKKSKGFPAAVKKYGRKNFKRETLFTYPDTKEGEKAAFKKEAEIVNWDFIRDPNTYNIKLGGQYSSPTKQRQVVQYDLDGKFIKVWNNMTEVEDYGIAPASSVSHCCVKETYSKQYQWRYYTGSTDNIAKVTPKIRAVYQFDLQGNYITYFKSISEASKATLIDSTLISNNCTGHQAQAGGYYWSYKKRFEYNVQNKKIAVACYNDDGTFIRSFDSMADAAKEYNISYSCISNCIKGRQKRCKNVRWRYFYGNTSPISSL